MDVHSVLFKPRPVAKRWNPNRICVEKSNSAPDLSIIVPTYHARELAQRSAEALDRYFRGLGISFEIVLVDDGSAGHKRPDEKSLPATAALVQLPANRGKGFAVRTGLLTACGRCRVFTDVDLPYGLDSLLACYNAVIEDGADFVYGDRSLPASTVVMHPSLRRRLSSAAFRLAVSTMVGLPPTDTQCGLKGFRGAVANSLVPLLHTDHFAFDVEIFRCAVDSGLAMQAIPVRLVNEDISTVRLLRDSVTMLRDLVAIRRRASRGDYHIGSRSSTQAESLSVG
jgi:dolichyl-phosphate beta-glucosyltransferase